MIAGDSVKKRAHINQTVVECLVKIHTSWWEKFYEFGHTHVKLFLNLTSMLLDYISISQVNCKTSDRKVLDWKVVYYVEESEYSRIEKIDKRFKKSFKLLGLSIKSPSCLLSIKYLKFKSALKFCWLGKALLVNKIDTPFVGKAKDYQPEAMDMCLTAG